MIKQTKLTYYKAGVAMTMGMMGLKTSDAMAQSTGFSEISDNVVTSIANFPAVVSAASYLIGIALGVLGIMKVKDHVENPGQTPLKEGAIRLAAGGALLALPTVFDAMITSIGAGGTGAAQEGIAAIELAP
jgi:hypothetical protein